MTQTAFEQTDVYGYLQALKTYAYGDLALFHQLAQNAELAEANTGATPITHSQQPSGAQQSATSGSGQTVGSGGITSSTMIYVTTVSPHGSTYSPPPISPKFRATIPFAMMMLSCMEMVGYLGRVNGNAGKTAANIKFFFRYVTPRVASTDIDDLVNLFRHGLAHNYFPKLGHGISYHLTNPTGVLFFVAPGDTKKTLNVNFLEYAFHTGLEYISQERSLYQTMDVQYNRLIQSYVTGRPHGQAKKTIPVWEWLKKKFGSGD